MRKAKQAKKARVRFRIRKDRAAVHPVSVIAVKGLQIELSAYA